LNITPELASSDGCSNELLSDTMRNDRQSLSEVATKKDCDATEGRVSAQKIPKTSIHSFNGMFVLHWNLIPNDKRSLTQNRVNVRTSSDFADGCLINDQGNMKG
jgi:hypothetical protein